MIDLQARLSRPLATHPGRGDAIGFVGTDLPIEVLLASGRPFGHLPWRASGPTPWADRWLESGFPGWARSILEQWHAGAFDGLATVVFSRADDASQRLYYYVRELQRRGQLRGPALQIFDLALVPRASSLAHSATAVLDLARALDVSGESLPAGIARANTLRESLQRLQQQRVSQGPWFEWLTRSALWNDPAEWIDEIIVSTAASAPRVLLAGSVPPDERLHRAVEDAGAAIIAEAHGHALGRLGPVLRPAPAESPESAIARQLRAVCVGPRAFLDRGAWLAALASETRAAAVILWLTREDEALAWHLPALRQALAAAQVPTLALPAARWLADDDTCARITAFCRETFR